MDRSSVVSETTKEYVILQSDRYLNSLQAEKLEEECEAVIKMGVKKIVIDFKNTELINSIGISILISVIEKLNHVGGNLSFSNLKKTHAEMFQMLGLTKFISIRETGLVLRKVKDCVVLYTDKYFNADCAEKLEEECNAFIEKGVKVIIINFQNTEFVNSIGISFLISIIENLSSIGGKLSFTNLAKTHTDTFRMLGLTKFVPIYETEEKALSHFK